MTQFADWATLPGNTQQDTAIERALDAARTLLGVDANDLSSDALLHGAMAEAFIATAAPAGGSPVFTSDLDVNGITVGRGNGGTGFSISNLAFGRDALAAALDNTAEDETAIGDEALKALTSGYGNTAVGARAGTSITTADQNVAIGADSMGANESGASNVAIGYAAMNGGDVAVARNIAIGDNSLAFVQGSDNVGIGHNALKLAAGSGNTCIGSKAGDSITFGARNIVIGKDADTGAATDDDWLVIGDATFEAASLSASVDATVAKKLRVKVGATTIYLLADVDAS